MDKINLIFSLEIKFIKKYIATLHFATDSPLIASQLFLIGDVFCHMQADFECILSKIGSGRSTTNDLSVPNGLKQNTQNN